MVLLLASGLVHWVCIYHTSGPTELCTCESEPHSGTEIPPTPGAQHTLVPSAIAGPAAEGGQRTECDGSQVTLVPLNPCLEASPSAPWESALHGDGVFKEVMQFDEVTSVGPNAI